MLNFRLLLLSLLIGFISYSQNENKNYDEAFQLLDVWLQAQTDFESYPGLSVVVVKDQDELWSSAYGYSNMEEKLPMSTESICSICSISKLFTSVAIMQLYDEGKLRLDDKVEDLLPWYNLKQQYKTSGPITIRSLLTHSSGLPRESDYPYWNGPDYYFPTKEELKTKLKEQETLYAASERYQYSNLGLTLLGEIVEEVSGMDFKDYVTSNIIEKLNLSNTRAELPEALYGNEMAIGYSAKYRDLKRQKVQLFDANAITPAAGFSSNPHDLGKFASWQLRLREADEPEILKPSTLRTMQNVHWINDDFGITRGLGFGVFKGTDGTKWVGHGGSCPGYETILRINPSTKMAYSVMINANGTSPASIASDIHAVLQKVETISEPSDTDTNVNLKDYIGYYSNQPWWSESYMSTWNGKLVSISLPTDNPASSMTFYEHVEGDSFVRIEDGEKREMLKFYRDSDGKVIRAKSHGYFSEKLNK